MKMFSEKYVLISEKLVEEYSGFYENICPFTMNCRLYRNLVVSYVSECIRNYKEF